MEELELTILIPCLNEEETIGDCVKCGIEFLNKNNVYGEVLVIDNNSNDQSLKIARKSGARVIKEKNRGYGSALIRGIKEAKGKYIIMGDADGSYDFSICMSFLELLRKDYDLVMGNRFLGGIEKDAMPLLHKYIGNPLLSFIGRKLFHIEVGDFHCGLRGFNGEKFKNLDLSCTGMDFASEMVIKAKLNNCKITEIPIILHKDKRINTVSHLSSFKDGMLHLKIIFRLYKDKNL